MKRMIVIFLSVMVLLICTASMATGFAETSVAANAARVENATIDPSVYLDYAAGIQAGVYRWFLSEDGSYYTLAAADENGEPITGQETAISVGANNEERRGMMGGAGRNGQMPQGSQGDFGGNPPQGSGGMRGHGGPMGSGGTVCQGVYMNAKLTNLNYQTMLVYVPAAYLTTDENGTVTGINHSAQAGRYGAHRIPE